MSLNISIPKADLAKSIPVSEGWHEFEVGMPFAKPTKAGDSVNYIIPHKIVNDPNEREIEVLFSAKALGMMNGWIAALTGKTVQEVLDSITTGTLNLDLETTTGKKVMGRVKQELYEGRIISKVQDWASVGKIPY